MEFFGTIEKVVSTQTASGKKRQMVVTIHGKNASQVAADLMDLQGGDVSFDVENVQAQLIEVDEVNPDQVSIDDLERSRRLEAAADAERAAESQLPEPGDEPSGFSEAQGDYIVGVDEGSPEGDMTAVVTGHVEEDGTLVVDSNTIHEAEPLIDDDVAPPPADEDAVTDIPTEPAADVKMTPELAKAMYAKAAKGDKGMKTVAPLRFQSYDGPLGVTLQVTGTSDFTVLAAEAGVFFAANGVSKIERVAIMPEGGAEYVAKVDAPSE